MFLVATSAFLSLLTCIAIGYLYIDYVRKGTSSGLARGFRRARRLDENEFIDRKADIEEIIREAFVLGEKIHLWNELDKDRRHNPEQEPREKDLEDTPSKIYRRWRASEVKYNGKFYTVRRFDIERDKQNPGARLAIINSDENRKKLVSFATRHLTHIDEVSKGDEEMLCRVLKQYYEHDWQILQRIDFGERMPKPEPKDARKKKERIFSTVKMEEWVSDDLGAI